MARPRVPCTSRRLALSTASRLYSSRADFYDRAFSWDNSEEVRWLLRRLGRGVRRVLEPGCGSGRMFPPFARLGVSMIGVDSSGVMLARARRRLADLGLPPPVLVRADMRDFSLDLKCDGAVCPINTFAYLTDERSALAHLRCVARHLRVGSRYLVQLDLRRGDGFKPVSSRWEAEVEGERLAIVWETASFDPRTLIEGQRSRFTVLSGPEKGRVVSGIERVRVWDWRTWSRVVRASPFRQAAAYRGDLPSRRRLLVGPGLEGKALTWHELERR